jgi:hypothetical protein
VSAVQVATTNVELALHYFNNVALFIGSTFRHGRWPDSRPRTATEIGVQFDSLADVLTFGIADGAGL